MADSAMSDVDPVLGDEFLGTSADRLLGFQRTDVGNGEMFAHEYASSVRYDHAAHEWRLWRPPVWVLDRDGEVQRMAKELLRARLSAAVKLVDKTERFEHVKWCAKSESCRGIDAMLWAASWDRALAVAGDEWDQHPMLFAVRNAVIDLRTGRESSGRAGDLLTKTSPTVFDPTAKCPRFERFMREIFATNPELVDYMHRVIGYALTGETTEQALWILFGCGANGKSTLMELLSRSVFGADYAWTMPFPSTSWSDAKGDYQKAALQGRRLVQSSEVSGQGRLNEEVIKSLTGCDSVNARHPFKRPFSFVPSAKFFLRVNNKPQIRDDSHGMWRRIKLVPFTETFSIDNTLANTLAAESAGILQWAIQGCREWQRDRLPEPAVVRAATSKYREENDPIAEFLAERCIVQDGVSVRAGQMFEEYAKWANDHLPLELRMSATTFGLKMKSKFDFKERRHVIYYGVALRSVEGR